MKYGVNPLGNGRSIYANIDQGGPEISMTNTIVENDLLRKLKDLSIAGLAKMFDSERQLFCYRVQKSKAGILMDGHSMRYTMISLLGLHRIEMQGEILPFNIQDQLDTLLKRAPSIDNIGDVGLLLWLYAQAKPSMIPQILYDLNLPSLLERHADAQQGKTTELAWFLSGLSYIAQAPIPTPPGIQDLTMKVYEMIRSNYGNKGIFGHQATNTFKGKLRGRIGSFADQVYSIYGFSKFGKIYDNKEALNIAAECGQTICQHQGILGQWWWHYDADTGNVIGKYPVYSVHQHGMAPMALFALAQATGTNLDSHINKGLKWIIGNNELGINMVDSKENVIWRSFYRKKYRMRFEELSALIGYSNSNKNNRDLTVLYESRPYCLGWLLYAYAHKIKQGENH